jgi:hypothetical protein
MKNRRTLHKFEKLLREQWKKDVKRRRRASKKGVAQKTISGTGCKDKEDTEVRGATGGIYITMEAQHSIEHVQQIVELREFLNSENNELKETSLRALRKTCPNLKLWIHDLACKANFADGLIKHRMLDRFHAKTHSKKNCKKQFDPDSRSNKIIKGKLKVKNTSICEQIWPFFNKHKGAKGMSRSHARAFWRHCCIKYNQAARSPLPVLLRS